jgi:LysM repeat protein
MFACRARHVFTLIGLEAVVVMKRWLTVAMFVVALVTMLFPTGGKSLAAPAPAGDGPNLLVNPGFESPFVKQCCQTDLAIYLPNTPIDEVQVAKGWYGWWLQPDSHPAFPSQCPASNPACVIWHRPEWREANCGNADCLANRVRSGTNAQKYFTFYSVHDSGMYQTVGGLTAGQRVRFGVYMQGWSTHADYGPSGGQQSMGMRIGIDPTGGTNPYSANVIWTPVSDVYDKWGYYSLEATAQGSAVTVFTRSTPVYPLQHNDIYVDDASLVVVGGAATSGSKSATATPVPTGTPYIIQAGDNLWRLARRFGVTYRDIVAVNPGLNVSILRIGQTIYLPAHAKVTTTTTPPPPTTPTTGSQTYVVQPGDSLWRIAKKFSTTADQLRAWNNLKTDVLQPGQVLIVAP